MNMHYEYKPKGICANLIELDVEDGVIGTVLLHNGCEEPR